MVQAGASRSRLPMWRIGAQGRKGPMSLMTIRRIGVPREAASTMPVRPPKDVPIQSISVVMPRWAMSPAMSAAYCGRP